MGKLYLSKLIPLCVSATMLGLVCIGTVIFAMVVTGSRTSVAMVKAWGLHDQPCENYPIPPNATSGFGDYPNLHEPFAAATSLMYFAVALVCTSDGMIQMAATVLSVSSMMLHANEADGSREVDSAFATILVVIIGSLPTRSKNDWMGIPLWGQILTGILAIITAFAILTMHIRRDYFAGDSSIGLAAVWIAVGIFSVATVIYRSQNNLYVKLTAKSEFDQLLTTSRLKAAACIVTVGLLLGAGWAIKDEGHKLQTICKNNHTEFANIDANHALWHVLTAYAACIIAMLLKEPWNPPSLAYLVAMIALVIYTFVAVAQGQSWKTTGGVLIGHGVIVTAIDVWEAYIYTRPTPKEVKI